MNAKVVALKPTVIKRLWAAVNHSPQQVLDFIDSISANTFDGKLKADIVMPEDVRTSNWDKKSQILIVVSTYALDLIASKSIDLSKVTIILIDNVVIATQYKDVKLLDCSILKSYHFKFLPLNSEMVIGLRGDNAKPIELLRSAKVDIIPNLLNAQPPSVLSPVMTFAYTIPDTDKRTKYLVDIFNAIRAKGNIDKLEWFKPDNKRMRELYDWMDSPIGRIAISALSDALNQVKPTDGSDEYYKLADDHNVAKFDINYAVEFIKRVKVDYPDLDTSMLYLASEIGK